MDRMKGLVMTPPVRFTRVMLCAFVLFVLLVGGMRGAQGMTIEEEKNMGKKVFLEIEQSTEIIKDLPLQDFVNRIGRSLLTQAGSTPFDFNFYIVKAQDPNAFAIPGGYIFVTTGLIVLADNEQEIAGVVSHEIAHATERHISELVDQSKRWLLFWQGLCSEEEAQPRELWQRQQWPVQPRSL
jgi:predicted Zn-dependent protease